MTHLALVPEQPRRTDETQLHPQELAQGQAADTREFMDAVRTSDGLRLPWTDLDRLVGPLLPGWLIAIGGRAKSGKTTLCRDLFTAWVELGKPVLYVGTETSVAALRYQWAAVRLGYSVAAALEPKFPVADYERLMDDVERVQTAYGLASRAMFADAREVTIADLRRWVRFAAERGAQALIFDHFHRLDVGSGERWQGLGDAARKIKNLAEAAGLTFVAAAQLSQGEGGSWLGEHEIPGNSSWAGTANLQRECDVGLQVWRPFVSGLTAKRKREAREDPTKMGELVQVNTMAVRVSAHRIRGDSMNHFVKLYVQNDRIESWSDR